MATVTVCQGDLKTQRTDVIVVCSTSKYLFDAICTAGGDSMRATFTAEFKKKVNDSVISVRAEGQLKSKKVYFLPCKIDPDGTILRQSIEKFVANAVTKASDEGYRTIAFPAIGCGQLGCSTSLVAEVMVEEAYHLSRTHNIAIVFVIQPQKTDVYEEFQKQTQLRQSFRISFPLAKPISVPVHKGVIEVQMGDITKQHVDVIIASSSSTHLRDAILKAAGNEVTKVYCTEYENNPHSILISTPPGTLPCKRIFFIKWEPDKDDGKLRQSLVDLIWTVIQNVMAYKFTSLAFPAIGCGKHACSVNTVVKTLVKEMTRQLSIRDLHLKVNFVIQNDQQNVYDEFCKQVLATQEDAAAASINYPIPLTWDKSNDRKPRVDVSSKSDEYKTIVADFNKTMNDKYSRIIRIERIQNVAWYIQYLAECGKYFARLNVNTERRLYHGCPETAANAIPDECFNRSCAGVNGTAYGVGVYFSSNAAYSHGYAKENSHGERHMFVARVLIGKTGIGNSSMKTRPVGYDSTTDGDHIFVTYHDAQAYADYLITYK